MNWNELSEEAQEVAKCMIDYCINNGIAMGMDEGFKDFDSEEKHPFRVELEKFLSNECDHQWYWDYACSDEESFCIKCGAKNKEIL